LEITIFVEGLFESRYFGGLRMTWSLVAVDTDGREAVAASDSNGQLYVMDALPAGSRLIDIIRDWDRHAPALQRWTINGAVPLKGAKVLQPLRYPSKLLCIGVNYRDHRQEMNADVNAPKATPFFFFKPPTTALIGPGEDILIRTVEDRVDWEAEVAIVISRGGRFIKREDALSHIAGVTLVNDISARGVHHRANAVHEAFAYDWVASKAQDGFCPIGPGIVPIWQIADLGDIDFQLTVNGKVEQSSNTGLMITAILDQVVAASEWVTLESGDVIATGTPSGVGAPRGLFLKEGDEVEVSAPLLGKLKNKIALQPRV